MSSCNLFQPNVLIKICKTKFEPIHFKVVKELLNHPKIDVNKPDKEGFTALMWAAYLNKLDIVKILLQRPDIEVKIYI